MDVGQQAVCPPELMLIELPQNPHTEMAAAVNPAPQTAVEIEQMDAVAQAMSLAPKAGHLDNLDAWEADNEPVEAAAAWAEPVAWAVPAARVLTADS